MRETTQMRTWAEIDLDALAHNYHALRALAPAGCRFLGVVKSNAYGHGAVRVAEKLQRLGADMLAVACIEEGRELRLAGITRPIQLRPQRFNLDMTPGSILVEVGANGNTHTEAMTAIRALGAAILVMAEGVNLQNTPPT